MNIKIYHQQKKLKEPYLSLFKEYKKRISPYAKLELVTFKKNKPKNKNEYIITLNSHSQLLSSEQIAQKFVELSLDAKTNLAFYINQDKEDKDFCFALLANKTSNEMTISILVEQIYRAFTIITGKSYHK